MVKRGSARRGASGAVAGLLACSVSAWPAPARADHTERDRQTDWSAFTLQQKQLRLGVFKVEYGLFDRWMIGTYVAPWILMPFLRGPILNLYTKVRVLDVGGFHLAGRFAFFYANVHGQGSSSVDDGSIRGTVLPVTLLGSYVLDRRWTLSGEFTWVQAIVHGDAESASEASVGGAVGQSNVQVALTAEYRISSHVALNLVTRFAPFVEPLQITSEAEVGDDTNVVLQAEVDGGAQNGFLIQPGVTFSWGMWNLRAGLGYGNIFIPGPMLVSGMRTLVPDFDFYVRF